MSLVFAGKAEGHASSTTLAITTTVAVEVGEALTIDGFTGFASMASVNVTDPTGNTLDLTNEEYSVTSSSGPFHVTIRPTIRIPSGTIITLTGKSAAAGTGTDVAETRWTAILGKWTSPIPSGVMLDSVLKVDVAPAASATPAPPTGPYTPTAVPILEVWATRINLVAGDSTDTDKVASLATAIAQGWQELDRISSYTGTSGIQTIVLWRESGTALPVGSATDSFTLDDATHTWRTHIVGLHGAIKAKFRASSIVTYRPTVSVISGTQNISTVASSLVMTSGNSGTPNVLLGATPTPGDVVWFAVGWNQNALDLSASTPVGTGWIQADQYTKPSDVGAAAWVRTWQVGDTLSAFTTSIKDALGATNVRQWVAAAWIDQHADPIDQLDESTLTHLRSSSAQLLAETGTGTAGSASNQKLYSIFAVKGNDLASVDNANSLPNTGWAPLKGQLGIGLPTDATAVRLVIAEQLVLGAGVAGKTRITWPTNIHQSVGFLIQERQNPALAIRAKFRASSIVTYQPASITKSSGAIGTRPTTHDKRYLIRGPADLSGLYFDNEVWLTGTGFTGNGVGFAKPPHFVDAPDVVLQNVWADWNGGGRAGVYVFGTQGAAPLIHVSDTGTTALARMQVEPNGKTTTVTVEYSTDPNTMSSSSASVIALGSGSREVVCSLSGLVPNQIYWARGRYVSSDGTTVTMRRMFRTPAATSVTTRHVATTGSDTNAGTAGAPFRTLSRALGASLQGDVVLVHGGSYPGEAITVRPSGLVRVSAAGDGAVNFASLDWNGAQWTLLENINIDGHGLADDPSVKLWRAHGTSLSATANHLYFFGGSITSTGTKQTCISAEGFSEFCYFDTSRNSGGGYGLTTAGQQVSNVSVDRSTQIGTMTMSLNGYLTPQGAIKGGQGSASIPVFAKIAALVDVFRGKATTHASEAPFQIQTIDDGPPYTSVNTTTWGPGSAMAWVPDLSPTTKSLKSAIDVIRSNNGGGSPRVTISTFGTPIALAVTVQSPPKPSRMVDYAEMIVALCKALKAANGGVKWVYELDSSQEPNAKWRDNLATAGWLDIGLPSTKIDGSPGSIGSYGWETNPSQFIADTPGRPGVWIPNAGGAVGASNGPLDDTNYRHYSAWMTAAWHNTLYRRVKADTDPDISSILVGGFHVAHGGAGTATDEIAMGSSDWNFAAVPNTGTTSPYIYSYGIQIYALLQSIGLDVHFIDYSTVGSSVGANRDAIVSKQSNMSRLINNYVRMVQTHPNMPAHAIASLANLDMIEFYSFWGNQMSTLDERTQRMLFSILLREIALTFKVRQAHIWEPEGDALGPGGSHRNTFGVCLWRSSTTTSTTNDVSGNVTNGGPGDAFENHGVAKRLVTAFPPGTPIYKVNTDDPEIWCMASATNVWTINTNKTLTKTFTVEGTTVTLLPNEDKMTAVTGGGSGNWPLSYAFNEVDWSKHSGSMRRLSGADRFSFMRNVCHDPTEVTASVSPLYGLCTDPASMGLSGAALVDAMRELGRDFYGNERSSNPAAWTVGAVEANPISAVGGRWSPLSMGTFTRTIYVGPSATGTGSGLDTANRASFNTFRTLAAPGDHILCAPGTYTTGSTFFLQTGGTATNPIWWQSETPLGAKMSPGGTSTANVIQFIDNTTTGTHPDYVIFDGFEVDGNNYTGNIAIQIQLAGTATLRHHIAVINCYLHHCRGGGIAFNAPGDYNRFDSNLVYMCGPTGTATGSGISYDAHEVNWTDTFGDGYAGIRTYIVNNMVIGGWDDNATSRTDGNGIIVDGGGAGVPIVFEKILIGNNIVEQNGNRAIHFFEVSGGPIYSVNNTTYNNGLQSNTNLVTAGQGAEHSFQLCTAGAVVVGNSISIPTASSGTNGTIPYSLVSGSAPTVFSCYYTAGGKTNTVSGVTLIADPLYSGLPAPRAPAPSPAPTTLTSPIALTAALAFTPAYTVGAMIGLELVQCSNTLDEQGIYYDQTNTIRTGPHSAIRSTAARSADVTGTTLVQPIVRTWAGDGIRLAGSTGTKIIQATIGNAPGRGDGVEEGSVGATTDLVASAADLSLRVIGCLVRKGELAAAPSAVINRNHFVNTSDALGTNSSTGAVTFVAADDMHLATASGTVATGGATQADDAEVKIYGADGIGHGSTVAKGAHASPASTAPLIPDQLRNMPQLAAPAFGPAVLTNVTLRGITADAFKSNSLLEVAGAYAGAVQIYAPYMRPAQAPSGGGALSIVAKPRTSTVVTRRPTLGAVQPVKAKYRPSGLVTYRPTQVKVGTSGGTDFFNPGPPLDWYKDVPSGGNRPSPTTFDPNARFGPRTNIYYTTLTTPLAGHQTRATARGAVRNDLPYYPRSLGRKVLSLNGGTNLQVGLDDASGIVVGASVWLGDLDGKDATTGKALKLKPKPDDKVYTVKSISGTSVTFNEPWTPAVDSGIYDAGVPGYVGYIVKNEPVREVIVTEAAGGNFIGTAGDAFGPYFKLLNASLPNSRSNPYVWTGGYTNRMFITGIKAAKDSPDVNGFAGLASLHVRFMPDCDIKNTSPEIAKSYDIQDGQLFNPFCTFQPANTDVVIDDGMFLFGMCGGTHSYADPLGGLYPVTGAGFSIGGISGVLQGLIEMGVMYDGQKGGQGAGMLQYRYCGIYRNRAMVAAGGGHTDGSQFAWVDNRGLPKTRDINGATWYRCYSESGGNGQYFLNAFQAIGSGGWLWSLVLVECMLNTGNKGLILDACSDCGMLRCLVNGDSTNFFGGSPNGQRPDALDIADGSDAQHPAPTGTVIFPTGGTRSNGFVEPVHVDCNHAVSAAGVLSPIPRDSVASEGATFTYVNG